ncbi:MAG: hypothetical protein KAH20_13835 [Methylococcales bacterium]|nr:hypothetical protein [Methylococcales bacterium]
MQKLKHITFLILFFLSSFPIKSLAKTYIEEVNYESYVKGRFKIYFALQEKNLRNDHARSHSLNESTASADCNNNNVPDMIENIGRQLVVAEKLYVNVFKLRHPI